MKIGDGYFQTLSVSGDTHLGGQDFDNRIFDHLVKGFEQANGIDLTAYRDEAEKKKKEKAKRKLLDKCQQAKHQLSDAEQVEIAIENFYGDVDLIQSLSR